MTIHGDDPAWNRTPGRTAAEANLDGAPFGFKVTGDAAWDPDSDDYAMGGYEGNALVASMVKTARILATAKPESEVLLWIHRETSDIAAVHSEIYDTMVYETIAYVLDETWVQAYGHRFGEQAM